MDTSYMYIWCFGHIIMADRRPMKKYKRYVGMALSSRLLWTISQRNLQGTCLCFHPFLSVNFIVSNQRHARGTSQSVPCFGVFLFSHQRALHTPRTITLFFLDFMNCTFNLGHTRHTYSNVLDISSHEHTKVCCVL